MSGSDIIEAPETPEPDGVTDDGPEPTPAAVPGRGVPALSVTADDIAAAADRLASGTGPFAVDAERASGFRYSNRAYLIQIRRTGAGTVLIDPVNHGGSPIDALAPVAEVLAEDEWILHAADQDLPCLAEVGLRPPALYDTELAGRLAGFEQVNLAAMVQRLLGLGLAKGTRRGGLVEAAAAGRLAELCRPRRRGARRAAARHRRHPGRAGQDRLGHRGIRVPALRRGDPDAARPLAAHLGIHKVRKPGALAAVRELWTVRDQIARSRDIAPGRILPDSRSSPPRWPTRRRSRSSPRCRSSAGTSSVAAPGVAGRARGGPDQPDPPDTAEPQNGPPPAARWRTKRKPEAAARLEAAARRWPRSPRG